MEWYGPLTVLPAIGLLILSTSNFIISLNTEITDLGKEDPRKDEIIKLKLGQLRKLGRANACLYVAALSFMIAGLSKALSSIDRLFDYFMLFGVGAATVALCFLFIHSLKSVGIRQKNLQLD